MVAVRASIDTRQIRQLTADLTGAPGRIQRAAPRSLKKDIRILHRAMKRDATGHRYLKGRGGAAPFQAHVAWEQTDALGLAYEVGFDKTGSGKLANIIVFGSVNNAPVYDFHGPLVRQTPVIVANLGSIAEGAVLGTDRAT